MILDIARFETTTTKYEPLLALNRLLLSENYTYLFIKYLYKNAQLNKKAKITAIVNQATSSMYFMHQLNHLLDAYNTTQHVVNWRQRITILKVWLKLWSSLGINTLTLNS